MLVVSLASTTVSIACADNPFPRALCVSGHDTPVFHFVWAVVFWSPRTHKDGYHTHATTHVMPISHMYICRVAHIHGTTGTHLFNIQCFVATHNIICHVWALTNMFLSSRLMHQITTTHFVVFRIVARVSLKQWNVDIYRLHYFPRLVFSHLSFYRPRCVRVSASRFNARHFSWCAVIHLLAWSFLLH